MKRALVVLLSVFLGALAATTSQNRARNLKERSDKTDGKVLVHQLCNPGTATADMTSLKKDVEALKNELIQRLNKKDNKVPGSVALLRKEVHKLGKDLTQRIEKIHANQQTKGPWIKLNTAAVCFGARDNQFGKFLVPTGGKLASIKLDHLYGFVTCQKSVANYWSYWGCSTYHGSLKDHIDVAITTSANRILLPSSKFITSSTKWSRIPGYNSFSPQLVMSAFSNPPSVTKGQQLRLWYGEDLVNKSESDNDGKACCDVYARFI